MQDRVRGFSLMEVFLALLVVSAVLAALASVIPLGITSMDKGQTSITASNLARQYLEWWKRQDFATLQALAVHVPPTMSYVDPLPAGPPLPPAPDPQQFGSLSPAVSDVVYHTDVVFSAGPAADLIQVDVYVQWQGSGTAGTTTALGEGTSEVHYSTLVYNLPVSH